jgi:DNA recombination protein RmuC
MIDILLIIIIVLIVISILLIFTFRPKLTADSQILENRVNDLQQSLTRIETGLKEDFRINREENSSIAKDNRTELNETLRSFKSELTNTLRTITDQNQTALEKLNTTLEQKITSLIEKTDANLKGNRDELSKNLKDFSDSNIAQLEKSITGFQELFEKNVKSFNDLQREKFGLMETRQNELVKNTETKLESIRSTVEEKLEKTLSERLGQSFETVGKQLLEVQRGLGEMQTLAQDVGGLKKVLSNVKMRGGFGEIQLSMLLEQILAPEQYQANVKTKSNSSDLVEFAIKLPGRDDNVGHVWLPVDAKFPKDVYEQLQNAYDNGDITQIELSQKNLDITIKKMARNICDKYVDPPNTTDFAIMFLPFEGIYAEVVRKASLLEELQRTCKVIVTGPTTLAAILNSLQMGFKTLAIQKRSSEVWKVLSEVKKEFSNFSGLMSKAHTNIQTGLNQLDDVMGKRTRAIEKKLKNVEAINGESATLLTNGNEEQVIDEE